MRPSQRRPIMTVVTQDIKMQSTSDESARIADRNRAASLLSLRKRRIAMVGSTQSETSCRSYRLQRLDCNV